MPQPFVPPAIDLPTFNCPFCGAYSVQAWQSITHTGHVHRIPPTNQPVPYRQALQLSQCLNCNNFSVWLDGRMIFPDDGGAPSANVDLPTSAREDYEEARGILAKSPRGAAALLRLAIQKICKVLNESGENINDDIASLVKKGLPSGVQKALDAVRVIGNNAVHPGQIDFADDTATAASLFGLVNFISEKMISEPKQIESIYGSLPPSSLAAIQKRDGGGN